MTYDKESMFQRAMMTGLFIGIIDTILCLGYNVMYRSLIISDYLPSALINVSSLIFSVNILLLIIGIIYFAFLRLFGKKDVIFTAVFAALTVFLIWRTETGHRFTDPTINAEFKGLLTGIVLVLGLSAAILPFLFRSKFFDKYIL